MQAVVQEILGPKPYRLYVKAIGKGAHHDPVISGGDTLQRKIPFPRRSASPLRGRIRTPKAAYTRSNSFSFQNRNESFSSWNSPDTIGVTFFWTGVRILRNRNSKSIRRSWDTRSDTGKALRWLWIPLASMKEPGSIRKATRIPASCTSSKSWLARASIICTSKPRSKTLGPTHGLDHCFRSGLGCGLGDQGIHLPIEQPLSGLLRQDNKGGHRNRKCRRRVWSWSSGQVDVSW